MNLDSQEFYELMQAYRHEPLGAEECVKRFEAIKDFIRAEQGKAQEPVYAVTVLGLTRSYEQLKPLSNGVYKLYAAPVAEPTKCVFRNPDLHALNRQLAASSASTVAAEPVAQPKHLVRRGLRAKRFDDAFEGMKL